MQIVFWGQSGLPALTALNRDTAESRAAALARQLAESGHDVTLFASQKGTVRQHHGVRVVRLGRWPQLRGIWRLWRMPPDVIHIHGWRTAVLARLLHLTGLRSVMVWTINLLPHRNRSGWLVRWLARGFTAVTVPTRTLQYQLLTTYGLRVQYVPDGYRALTAPDVPARQFGLVKGLYALVLANDPAAVRAVARAYQVTGSRKKLVVLTDKAGSYIQMARRWPFLVFVGPQGPRVAASLAQQATVTILGESTTPVQMLLRLMDRRAVLVAPTAPLYQETLGVAAQYYAAGDLAGLVDTLRAVTSDSAARQRWARAAQIRAQRHFTWARVALEYESLYASQRQFVPMDSARPVPFVQPV